MPRNKLMASTIRLAEAAGALACGHVACTLIGIGNASITKPPPLPVTTSNSEEAAQITKVVSKMYSGGGLDPTMCTDHVTFTDPAARCTGRAECVEAFRALRAFEPQHVEEPSAVAMPDGSLHLYLHQRYSILTSFTIRSVLVVRTDDTGRVSELEERWNGAPLIGFPAFRWVRRVNGVVSSLLTPIILR